MPNEIKPISLSLPFRMGSVNCYLVSTGSGYILIDTGGSNSRRVLAGELERAGCKPGSLNLILLTHGDFDHSGNAAYLRRVFGGKIAMHRDDAGMGEKADMFVNRKRPGLLIRMLIPVFTGFGRAERFTPDLLIAEGDSLLEYGINARVLSIPGHSLGSIGVLTADHCLFCGDLLENMKGPSLNSLIDDPTAARASLERLRGMGVETVYPGHGGSFSMNQIME